MSTSVISLVKKYIILGKIEAVSGLHIGGTDTGFSIGSTDATVIKHPISGEPYIPGSSLKGKMRSLTELRDGTIGNRRFGVIYNGPTENAEDLAAQIYGTANNSDSQRPSRIIVRDAKLSDSSKKKKDGDKDFSVVEIKTEVLIDRLTSKAMPRSMERVPAGAQFDLEIILNVFTDQDGKEQDHIEDVLSALLLVQDDYLGGKGSRGSGQVAFKIEELSSRTPAFYKDASIGQSDEMPRFQVKFPKLF